ncbi:MAG: hypothetical protein HEQ32_09435 [Vampirovibrio sp.]
MLTYPTLYLITVSQATLSRQLQEMLIIRHKIAELECTDDMVIRSNRAVK